ncbi:hypothetical protein N1851_006572 [Merluccius polli]|uniref:Uncharacterized protein n=1 Tax=Merluccius polli TaxID=89951 RepID=A0AA47P5U1_MERPO|nr:hypothetical protein N1851_006572 [Merluccius polli]
MVQTFLRSAITEVLPDLSEINKDILEEHLQSLGVETSDDFQFIEEADLLTVLRPIQARKVLAAWKLKCKCNSKGEKRTWQQLKMKHKNIIQNEAEKLALSQNRGRPAAEGIPGGSSSEPVAPQDTSAYIRCKYTLMSLKKIKLIYKYIAYFLTHISTHPTVEDGVICLQPPTETVNPAAEEEEEDDEETLSAATGRDPEGPTEHTAGHHQEGPSTSTAQLDTVRLSVNTMLNLYVELRLMKLTFYAQRKKVNQGQNIKNLLDEWPLLFDELGMAVHFQELTGLGLKEVFSRNLELKGKRLLNYMNKVSMHKSRKFLQAVTKYQVMRGELSGCSEDLKDMVLLLLSYFDEKEDAMFVYVEDTCLAGEVQMDQLPLTPTIVVCGRSCYSANRFMLSVDRNIVQDNIPSFVSALCLMFGSYYCFNIHNPSCLASTLEFLQRCFFSINPEKGTKIEKTKTSRLHVNPRVIKFIQDLSDHEWRDAQ